MVRTLAAVSLALFLAASVLSAIRPPLMDPDEGRNAEVAREMLQNGEWIVPSFHGLPYLDKPALFFDAIALSFRFLGRSEFAARLPSLLSALGLLALTWLLARDLFGAGRAWASMAVLASAPLFLIFARTVIFDMTLTCFVTLAIWLGQAGCQGRRWGGVLAWVAIAMAVLTKGPVGLVLPILATAGLTIGRGGLHGFGRFFHPLGLAAFALVIVPWLWVVEAREPGFLRYALLVESFERVVAPTFHRTGPVWYYLPILLLALFPWSVVALVRLPFLLKGVGRGALRKPSAERGLLLAFAAIFVFFSLSQSKLGGYILPALPLAAILIAGEVAGSKRDVNDWSLPAGLVLIACGIISAVISSDRDLLGGWARLPRAQTETAGRVVLSTGVVSMAMGVFLAGARRWRSGAGFAMVIAFPAIVFLSLSSIVRFSEENSSKGMADFIREHGGEAIAIRSFPTGLDYYLNRIVPIVTEDGREITSTYVTRNYRQLVEGGRARSLWSLDDLRGRLQDTPPRTHILVTRSEEPPTPGFGIVRRFGRFRLWASEALPSSEKP